MTVAINTGAGLPHFDSGISPWRAGGAISTSREYCSNIGVQRCGGLQP